MCLIYTEESFQFCWNVKQWLTDNQQEEACFKTFFHTFLFLFLIFLYIIFLWNTQREGYVNMCILKHKNGPFFMLYYKGFTISQRRKYLCV